MAWERPISYEDELNSWENEEMAFDGDLDTWAKTIPLPPETWTGWLVFEWPPFMARQLWFTVNCPTASFAMDSDLWNGSEWVPAEYWGDTTGPRTAHGLLPPQVFSKLRIRFQHHGADWLRGELNDVRIDRICGGPLINICGFLGEGSEFFADLADDIEDVILVGDYLAAPFEALAGIFSRAQSACCSASTALQELLDALEAGVSWEAVLGLIQEHWPELIAFIDDPVAYLTDIVQELIPELPEWLDDPVAYITEIVQELIPELPDWLDDPIGWLTATLQEHFPTLYAIHEDPDAWLRERVEALLRELFEDVEAFLENAWSWLLDRYEDAFENIHDRLYYLAEHTLRYFWEGEW